MRNPDLSYEDYQRLGKRLFPSVAVMALGDVPDAEGSLFHQWLRAGFNHPMVLKIIGERLRFWQGRRVYVVEIFEGGALFL